MYVLFQNEKKKKEKREAILGSVAQFARSSDFIGPLVAGRGKIDEEKEKMRETGQKSVKSELSFLSGGAARFIEIIYIN